MLAGQPMNPHDSLDWMQGIYTRFLECWHGNINKRPFRFGCSSGTVGLDRYPSVTQRVMNTNLHSFALEENNARPKPNRKSEGKQNSKMCTCLWSTINSYFTTRLYGIKNIMNWPVNKIRPDSSCPLGGRTLRFPSHLRRSRFVPVGCFRVWSYGVFFFINKLMVSSVRWFLWFTQEQTVVCTTKNIIE